ncbi:MBL fold metallo-hydrolase [Ferruginibacter albus]|uniref:MBL fold metallo-hydrolase n=1 Tax=Ferruginibacter albus TaxID=2875540 RepID=UPI001CC3D579|nr:MBL fold metallo-hydrolase [Ferruginibacter albus]UAY51762.1 MBL fold metallo-hydrolase [Ferruginibacter albus]
MFTRQLYTRCLSEAAYYIESNGIAAVIDPLRDIDEYIALAKERNATIKYIFETHFHADFVSGHLDLAKQTNATIIYGPQTVTSFPVYVAKDGETFSLGSATVTVLHTPGHTIESSCYLLKDEAGKDVALFSGDTLFVGDVGRPDLSSGNLSKEELAAIMFDTLQNKIKPLADDIILYPAHGAGSSCGKNLGPDTYSTIGEEKKNNYALQITDKTEFIKEVINGLSDAPKYFSINAKINKEGYDSLDSIKMKGLTLLSIEQFKEKIDQDVIVLDTRDKTQFAEGFIPGSIFIGLEGRFAEWAGTLLPFDKTIILLTEKGKEEETVVRLARVGFSKIEGYLDGGFEAWQSAGEPIDMIIDIEADELAMDIPFDKNLRLLDVRRETEFAEGHVKNALSIPLEEMTDIAKIANFEEHDNLYVYCNSGYRSVIAASLIKKQGIHNLRNVLGGWQAIKEIDKIDFDKNIEALN